MLRGGAGMRKVIISRVIDKDKMIGSDIGE
jgi:hypothetical protein